MKFEHTDVAGLGGAIRSMRNALSSWSRSDSYTTGQLEFVLGENDKDLAQRLIKAGSEHRKFLRSIYVSVDISAPQYLWAELDTYKVGTVRNSCSFMHKGVAHPFTLSDFELSENHDMDYWEAVLEQLNYLRDKYLETKDYNYFLQIREILPMSYIYKATWTANYEVVRSIVLQRRNHKLPIWQDFMAWTHDLPYAEELIWFGVDK